MAGHSHWAGIKHKKAANDAKRGKIFSKLAKLIYTAVKEGGGGDPNDNPRLRLVLEKCRQANMPKDNVKRAIERGLGTGGGYDPMTFEGYGPSGIALIVECLTDNSNRTAPEVRYVFDRAGAKLGKQGCVQHMFQRKGIFNVSKEAATEEQLLEIALEAGAEDVIDQGDFFEIRTDPGDFVGVGEAFETAGIETESGEVQLVPDNTVQADLETARKVLRLVDQLEELDDTQNVYTNIDVNEDVAAALAADQN
jgi:YebC/PmpR family DNA-binding regulatory protein